MIIIEYSCLDVKIHSIQTNIRLKRIDNDNDNDNDKILTNEWIKELSPQKYEKYERFFLKRYKDIKTIHKIYKKYIKIIR
jgi:hypothetical protein